MQEKEKKPLVSCTVICYNSAKTVVETLESVKNQTYSDIELIVSDDCSTDDTVIICREWIEKNKNRFVRTELITVEKNTGVCGNCNRALAACRGEWQKGIAADDIMLPNCIEDFVNYVTKNKGVRWVSSYIQIYKEEFKPEKCIANKTVARRSLFDCTREEQLKQMAVENLISSPSCFYSLSVKREIEGYNTRYSYEDYPMFITLLEKGYKCYFLDTVTIGYRIHESVSRSHNKLFNIKFLREDNLFKKERCYKYLSWWEIIGQKTLWAFHLSLDFLHLNRDTPFMNVLYNRFRSLFRLVFFHKYR